jgi:hypothetical protein
VPDSLLIITPLLVLAVVLVLGFAGCTFTGYTEPPQPPPPTTLIFKARVPTGLTALGGVSFRWVRPTGTMGEVATVMSSATEGEDNVYKHELPSAEAGLWHVSCEMTAQNGGNQEPKSSPVREFGLTADSQTHVYLFEAKGIPLISFEIVPIGLDPP